MYCSNCGTKLTDDAVFCCHCGKRVKVVPVQPDPAVNLQAQQYQAQKGAMRSSELASLSTMMQHFSQKQSAYDLYDAVCEKVNHFAKGCSNALLIWGGILVSFSFMLLLMFIPEIQEGVLPIKELPEVLLVMGVLIFGPGIMMIIGGILMKVNNKRQLAKFRGQYAALTHELHQHYLTFPNCPIGPEYTNPHILFQLQNLILSGRTDTVKESLNHLLAAVNRKGITQYTDITRRNTTHYNIGYIFIPSKFFK
jgi:hypothetical protein